jgi:hypothetical protein
MSQEWGSHERSLQRLKTLSTSTLQENVDPYELNE